MKPVKTSVQYLKAIQIFGATLHIVLHDHEWPKPQQKDLRSQKLLHPVFSVNDQLRCIKLVHQNQRPGWDVQMPISIQPHSQAGSLRLCPQLVVSTPGWECARLRLSKARFLKGQDTRRWFCFVIQDERRCEGWREISQVVLPVGKGLSATPNLTASAAHQLQKDRPAGIQLFASARSYLPGSRVLVLAVSRSFGVATGVQMTSYVLLGSRDVLKPLNGRFASAAPIYNVL